MSISAIFGAGRTHMVSSRKPARAYRNAYVAPPSADEVRLAQRQLHRRVASLHRQLALTRTDLQDVRSTGAGVGLASVSSGSSLALDLVGTKTTLDGSEEVNTKATSFTPRGPGWDGPRSTSEVTIGGTYSGLLEDTLEFRAQSDRTVGGNASVRFRIYDSAGDKLQNLDFPEDTPADTPLATDFGLTVSLGAGDVERNESFFVIVSATTGTSVKAANPMNGTRDQHAELDDGESVVDGSFTVNGELIAVSGSDSLDDVVARINASDAGVTARYDAAADTVRFQHDTAGATEIELAGDTSGFLAAMKLDDGDEVLGLAPDQKRTIDQVGALGGIGAGTFTITDTEISIDPTVDTLEDIIARINASDAGVTASFDTGASKVKIVANTAGEDVTLDDGTSGFFTALDMKLGTEKGSVGGGGSRRQAAKAAVARSAVITESFTELFAAFEGEGAASRDVRMARTAVVRAIAKAMGVDSDDYEPHERIVVKKFGMVFDLTSDRAGDILRIDESTLDRALTYDKKDATAFLLGAMDGSSVGLLDEVMGALAWHGEKLGQSHGFKGVMVNVKI